MSGFRLAMVFAFTLLICAFTKTSLLGVEPKKGDKVDEAKLLVVLNGRIADDDDLSRVDQLIRQLGDDAFEKREEASRRLVPLGRLVLPKLNLVQKSVDQEVARRATGCVQEIEEGYKTHGESKDIIHTLLQRKTSGLVEILVRFLPFAEDVDTVETIYYGVDSLLGDSKKVDDFLFNALKNRSAARRAIAGLCVGKNGDEEQKREVLKLLEDVDNHVRLRAAQGLLAGENLSGVPTLIQLLEKSPLDLAWQAEELLIWLSGNKSVKSVVIGNGSSEERLAAVRAWRMWWDSNRLRGNELFHGHSEFEPRLYVFLAGYTWNWIERQLQYATQEEIEKRIEKMPEPELRRNRFIWLCGNDGQLRCSIQLCQDEIFKSLAKNGLILELQLKNGNNFHYDKPSEPRVVHGFVEKDSKERIVWEGAFNTELSYYKEYSLVRVGFARHSNPDNDLSRAESRVSQLQNASGLKRCLAMERLEKLPLEKASFKAAVQALNDPDVAVRKSALRALQGQEDTTLLYRLGMTERSGIGPRTSEAMPQLLAKLDDDDSEVRWEATKALVGCGSKVIPHLLTIIEQTENDKLSNRRECAIRSLCYFLTENDRKVTETVRNAFREPNWKIRNCLACRLGWLRDERYKAFHQPICDFAREFADLLEDPNKNVASNAVSDYRFLGSAGSVGIPHCLRILDSQPKLRVHMVQTLIAVGKNDDRVAPALLQRIAQDTYKDLVPCMLESLGECWTADNVQTVLKTLMKYTKETRTDVSEEVNLSTQQQAIASLAKLGGHAKQAIQLLCELLESKDNTLADEAMHSIDRIDPLLAKEIREKRKSKKIDDQHHN